MKGQRRDRRCGARGRALGALVIAAIMLSGLAGPSRAQPLIADLSKDSIEITTGFTGAEVLLFGTIEREGDVLVVVRGPAADAVVRRKDRIAGIWINRERMRFSRIPSFYRLASSRPLEETLPIEILERYEVGLERLALKPQENAVRREKLQAFRAALIRILERESLYRDEVGEVKFLDGELFRVQLFFPANVATGIHRVEVYLVRDGALVGVNAYPLEIRKIGLGAEVFRFAHQYPARYGAIAIVLALLAGWLASIALRKR